VERIAWTALKRQCILSLWKSDLLVGTWAYSCKKTTWVAHLEWICHAHSDKPEIILPIFGLGAFPITGLNMSGAFTSSISTQSQVHAELDALLFRKIFSTDLCYGNNGKSRRIRRLTQKENQKTTDYFGGAEGIKKEKQMVLAAKTW